MSWRSSHLFRFITIRKGCKRSVGLHIRILYSLSCLWLTKLDALEYTEQIVGDTLNDSLGALAANDPPPHWPSRPSMYLQNPTGPHFLRRSVATFGAKPLRAARHRPFSPLYTPLRGAHVSSTSHRPAAEEWAEAPLPNLADHEEEEAVGNAIPPSQPGRRKMSGRNNRTTMRRAPFGGLEALQKSSRAAKPPKGKAAAPAEDAKSPASAKVSSPAARTGNGEQRRREVAALARLPQSALRASIARKRLFIQQRRQQRELLRKIQSSTPSPVLNEGNKPNARPRSGESAAVDAAPKAKRRKTTPPALGSPPPAVVSNPLYFPDYREQVLVIFQQLGEINIALGEKYKTQSYQVAVERLKREENIFKLLPPHLRPLPANAHALGTEVEVNELLAKRAYALDPSRSIPGIGDKLRRKIVEILTTGDLEELHTLEAKPVIRAIRQLTQVHGFGPRTAMSFYKDYGISNVEELKAYAERQDGAKGPDADEAASGKKGKRKKAFHLTDAQRIGLKYYKDIQQRIPYNECRLHEAFLKLRLRKHLGRDYELTVCGSYRRKVATSGDIDVLITRRDGLEKQADPLASSQDALGVFTAALQDERYIEATLAQGPTKFMGVCRLRGLKKPGASDEGPVATRRFHARRIDIRFVDAASYPAAMLYFTGSKNFNVIMRAEAIKKNFILNEYGLFRNRSSSAAETGRLHEMIGQLSKAQYYTSKKGALSYSHSNLPTDEENDGPAATRDKRGRPGSGKMQPAELMEVLREVEALRVKVQSEKDIFDAIGMSYVEPQNRNL
ncbi:unnamed protein product [Phytomonas sp. Hart1]|nr:unnamed protein product [Phytomonas sp. Hart1]|eukprot:CCW68493.1 unnamed protein product [Phytomonas sp. isolate Hart1]